MRLCLLIFLLLSLASCGFHLRGQTPLAEPLHSLYLKSKDPYGQLARNLRQYLKMSGVVLASDPHDANTILEIISETESQQLQSVSGTQQTRQYNLVLTVTFQVTDSSGRVLVPTQSLSESRPLTILSNQILGGSNEQANLYQQMRLTMVFDIMNRLSSHEITHLLNAKPELPAPKPSRAFNHIKASTITA